MKAETKSKSFQWGLTQQFSLFFILGAILPVVLLGVLITGRTYWRLSLKQDRILNASKVVTQSIMQRDLNSLELSAYQTADVVIPPMLEQYNQHKRTFAIQKQLARLIRFNHAKFVAVYDKNGQLILAYINGKFTSVLPSVLQQEIRPILRSDRTDTSKASVKASVEQLSIASDAPNLYYTALAPIHGQNSYKKTIGYYIVAKSLQELLTIEDMRITIPGADITLLDMQKPSHIIYTTNNNLNISEIKREELSDKVRFQVLKIYNRLNAQVGEAILYSQHIEFSHMAETGIVWVLASLILGLVVLSWLGFYLHHCFVKPVTKIAEAAKLISTGNFNTQVELLGATAEVKTLINNFNKMTSALEHAEESKQHNIAALTHDLRTPLLAESRVFELFEEDEGFPAELRPLLHDLIDSNHHQLDMVNQLLTIYHYEAGEFPLRLSLIDINHLIQPVLQHLQHLADKNNVALIYQPVENIGRITVDEKQLRRVLINILMNAIENISPIGNYIKLEASVVTDSNNTGQKYCEVIITDNGPGIPNELQENWFDKYASHQLNKKIGSGLGLSICKKIIEQHNGTIIINESIVQGTQFIIRIPLNIPVIVESIKPMQAIQ